MARNMIQSRSFRGILGDKWLLKLEKKACGWHHWSSTTEDEVGYEVSSDSVGNVHGRETHKYIEWLEFRRQSPYTGNFLFKLNETLGRIFSFFRRILISIGIYVFAIALIGGLIMRFGCDEASMGGMFLEIAKWLAIAYAISVGVTLLFSGLAILWRKAFGIDKKLKAVYGEDLSDCRFHDED